MTAVPDAAAQQELRRLAERAAQVGGAVAHRFFAGEYAVRLKDDRSEVSEADEAAQHAVVEAIRAARPADAFIAEEDLHLAPPAPAPAGDGLCWVVDPIDGTRNFVRHIPLYCSSIAVLWHGSPVAGAIYEPERDRLFSGSLTEGLFVDGENVPVRGPDAERRRGLNPRPIVALPSRAVGPAARPAHAWLDRFVCRNLGSTALHMALVGSGELDGMLADYPRLWDFAAGWLFIAVTGGRVIRMDGGDVFPIDLSTYRGDAVPLLAASAAAYDALRDV